MSSVVVVVCGVGCSLVFGVIVSCNILELL